jgi:hypothetical protein
VKRVDTTARRAPSGVAGVLEQLELRQPKIVNGDLLSEALAAAGVHLTPQAAAERLVREGWLAPLRTRGAWEFVPASRAGRYPSGDPKIELRALLTRKPDAPVALAFASAVWELGYSTHQPSRLTYAHRTDWRPPRSLSDARTVKYEWVLPTELRQGIPLWHPATTAVAAADRPDCQDNWANADDWLPELMRAITPQEVRSEATGRGTATLIRLSYLAEWSGRHDVVDALTDLVPENLPVTFFGPRQPRGRWVKQWRLYDSLLPDR